LKISASTLAAAKKIAKEQGMTLDAWAEQVLANAVSANQPSTIDALLKGISGRIDQIVDRQNLGEKVNEQLAAAVKEASSSYEQVKKTTGHFLGDVGAKTSSAVEEMAGKARDLIGQVNKSAADLAERLSPHAGDEAAAPPARKPRASSKAKTAKAKAATPKAAKPKAAKPKAAKPKAAKPKAPARRPAAAARKNPVKRPGKKT
jgi:hypothetical protein